MAETTYENLLLELRGDGVAVLTINRPRKLNAFDARTRREVAEALRALESDPEVGAVVLTGAGERGFCAGQDLAEARQHTAESAPARIDEWREMYRAFFALEKPIVAAVNGYAVGAGFQLAANCDLRIAAESARFSMPDIDDGTACVGGAWSLWSLIGRARTTELILSARMIDAREALAWGIVGRVVPKEQLMGAALELARGLAAKPRVAMRLNKRWLRELMLANYERSNEFVKEAHAEAYASGDPQRAAADFLAGRREGRST